MEISSKEKYNVDNVFMTMIQDVHIKHLNELEKGISNNNNNNILTISSKDNGNSSSFCCV